MNKESTLVLPISIPLAYSVAIFGFISIVSFITPFMVGHPQWLVGTLVNTCLFSSAFFLPKKYILPIAIFPSLGVLARGLVFGPLTSFLVYFLPFIWMGNIVLIVAFRGLFSKVKYFNSLLIASALKFAVLFGVANLYLSLHLVPKMFLQTMGLFQLLTAMAGGIIAFLILNIYGKYNVRS